MGKAFTFNWEIFKGKGFEFQEMCADIFREHNYAVRVMEPGGSDEGRDIELYNRRNLDFANFNAQPFAWVECKSRVASERPLKATDINVNFIYAFKSEISYLIFVTNHKFNNEAHNVFQSYNGMHSSSLKIRYIEREELERIIGQLPEIYLKYFDASGKVEDYNFVKQSSNVDYQTEPNSKFWDEFGGYNVKLKSSSLETQQIDIESPSGELLKLSLLPLEEKCIFFSSTQENPEKRPKIYFATQKDGSTLPTSLPDRFLAYKIDHIYVDPFGSKEKVLDALKLNRNVYLAGGPGRGKSRLLKEVSGSLSTTYISFDLSSDYSKSLLECILFKILKIEREYLKFLPDEVILKHFGDSGIHDEVSKIFLAYVKESSAGIDYETIINVVAELFVDKFKNEVIFFDNVHKFSLLDFKLFETIVRENKTGKIVCAARNEEILEASFKAYLQKLVNSNHFQSIDLEKVNIHSAIGAFIEEASFDRESALFLKKYQTAENFQQFVFCLKNLRANGLLSQKKNGKLLVIKANESITNVHDYKELFEDLVKALNYSGDADSLLNALFLCSVYGFRFPLELLQTQLKDENKIDELIQNELICIDNNNSNNSIFLRFDHELTHSIIYNSVPAIRKVKLRMKVIEFIQDLGEESPLFSFRQLAEQFEGLNNFQKAADCANKEGYKLFNKGQLPEAYDQFEKSLTLMREFQKNSGDELPALEASSLSSIIEIGLDHFGSNEKTYNQIRSLHVLTHLIADDNFYEGKVYYFFAKHYFENGTTEGIESALNYITRATTFFESKSKLEYAKCLNFMGVINKNIGRYELALDQHKEAAIIFEQNQNWEGLSEAYVDLGATYLESGQGNMTFQWWLKSLNTIKRTLNLSRICNRLLDYSYIAALYQEKGIDIMSELENALYMAERLKMEPNICRAHINFSNYLFFSGQKYLPQIKEHIDKAISISKQHDYKYLVLLSRFSYLMFSRVNRNLFAKSESDEIVKALIEQYWDDNDLGDNRIMNMFKFFICREEKSIIEKIGKSDNVPLKEFVDSLNKTSVSELEKSNPYFFNGGYLTYY